MSWPGLAAKAQRIARRAVGEPIEYRREGYAVLKFNAVFIDSAVKPLVFDGLIASAQSPMVDVTLSEMGGLFPERDDEVYRVDNDTCYLVSEIHPDGEGEVSLKLQKLI